MGFGGISIWQLLIVLAIVVLLFGTKRLRGMGGDLGNAVKGFRKAMHTEEEKGKEKDDTKAQIEADDSVIDGTVEKTEHKTTENNDK